MNRYSIGKWACSISFGIQISLWIFTKDVNHYLFILPLIGMFWFGYKEMSRDGVRLPCDTESCMCGTKDCIFWKSLPDITQMKTLDRCISTLRGSGN